MNSTEDLYGQIDPSRIFNSDYWTQFGPDPDPDMREKMLYVTIDDIGRIGHTAFNAKLMCDALQISPSLVNHHFGGRDELIAEATVLCYRNYVQLLWQAVESVPREPEARLREWLRSSIYWSVRMSGWGPLLNYPKTSLAISRIIDERYREEMNNHAELNMSRLLILVGDLKRGSVSRAEMVAGKLPRLKLLRDMDVALLTASIGWSVLGVATWSAGRHMPTRDLEISAIIEKKAVDKHIDRIIESVRN